MTQPETLKTIEFWFDFASNYSYLSAMRIEDEADKLGVQVLWRPFLLGPIFQSFGWHNSPFVLQPLKGAYVWRDMERLVEKYQFAWQKPSQFPRHSTLAARIAIFGQDKGWTGDFARRVFTHNFAHDTDISQEANLLAVLDEMGLDAEAVLHKALSDENKKRLRLQTEQAQARGMFGAPMFFVGQEMFWGDDRLDDALCWAAAGR